VIAEFLEAASAGSETALRELLYHARVNVSAVQWTPRQLCAGIAHYWPHWCAQAECSALHLAAANGHARCVELLLQRGAEAAATTRHGATPLMLAAWQGHTSVLECLLERTGGRGVDAACSAPSHGHRSGPTALMLAAASVAGRDASAACVQVLLAAGANPHLLCTGRLGALHVAAASHHAEACAHLVAAGCWLQQPDAAGRTPLDLARWFQADLPTVARSLCWLPSVRLLWLGHLSTPGMGLGLLTRDAMRAVCAAITATHTPPEAPAVKATPDGSSAADKSRLEDEEYLFAHRFALAVSRPGLRR
jgi:hypothetical protein